MGMAIPLIQSLGSSSASPLCPIQGSALGCWVGLQDPLTAQLVALATHLPSWWSPWRGEVTMSTHPTPRTDTLTNTSLQEFGGLSSISMANTTLALPSVLTVFGRKKSYFSCVSAGRRSFIVEEGKSSPELSFSHLKKGVGERVRTK